MNTALTVNARLDSPAALERALAARLRELLGAVDWLRGVEVVALNAGSDRGFDLLAKLPLPTGGAAALCVECKREMRPSTFSMLAQREFKPNGRPKVIVPVLALPWVSPRVAELCAEHGWSWFDLAGNYRIDVPGVLHLQHSGNASVHERPRPTANLGTKEAGRVVRALLTEHARPKQPWTQRVLNIHCKPPVSLGLVNKMVRHLTDEGFIEASPDGGFHVTEPVKLLFAWRDAYRFGQHERHEYFSLLQEKPLRESLTTLDNFSGGYAAYAAFSAADFQAPHVRQPKTWLYVSPPMLEYFAKVTQSKPVDSGGNLVVLVPSDEGVFIHRERGNGFEHRLPCTHAVQTYVDLWHCGGRGQEAAEAVLEQQLKPAWSAAGLKA